MKNFEYVYNVINYFYFKAMIRFGIIFSLKLNPFVFIFKLCYKFQKIKDIYKKRGIKDPIQLSNDRTMKLLNDPEKGPSVYTSQGITASLLFFTFLGIYHIPRALFFPNFEDYFEQNIGNPFLYQVIFFGFFAMVLSAILLSGNGNVPKSVTYLKEFDKKTGFWRTKWKIIAFLAPFVTIYFALTTGVDGDIGRFLLNLH